MGRPSDRSDDYISRARRGVHEWVREAGDVIRDATPNGIFALLTASALAPLVGPMLNVDAFGTAIISIVGAMGTEFLSDVVSTTAQRLQRGDETPSDEAALRDAMAVALRAVLDGPQERARKLRMEMGAVLQAVDAIPEALAAAEQGDSLTRAQLKGTLLTMAHDLHDQQWMISVLSDDVQEILSCVVHIRINQDEMTDRQNQLIQEIRQGRSQRDELRHTTPPASDSPDPYVGLSTFQLKDARWFHGRDALVAEVLSRLIVSPPDARILVVTGVSGSGKSSLLRAGVLPAIARGDLTRIDGRRWEFMLLTPGRDPRKASDPLLELVTRTAKRAGLSAVNELQTLRSRPQEFGALAAQAAMDPSGALTRLLIVVDQFEEVFTHCTDDARAAFVTALTHATPARVIIALRADFYPNALRLAQLDSDFRQPLTVGPMTSEELHAAIMRPAKLAGLEVEAGLFDLLATETQTLGADWSEAGKLPLLAHALRATWQRGDGTHLAVAGYRATGGIKGAIATTAERHYQQLDAAGRDRLRTTLLRLITVTEAGQAVRRHAATDEVDRTIIDRMVTDRLVISGRDGVTLSHEALLHAWPRLHDWVDEYKSDLVVRRQIDEAATDWTAHDQDRNLLIRGSRLTQAKDWAARAPDLTEPEQLLSTPVSRRPTKTWWPSGDAGECSAYYPSP